MATYTAPTTRTTGALISASIWNTDIVENLKYFKDAPVFDGDISVGDDIFLTSTGAVINFASGDVTVTHSTNTLTFAGAASGYVFNDGNVGIGVTPSYDLHLQKASAAAGSVITALRNTTATGATRLYLGNDSSDSASYFQIFGTTHALRPSVIALGGNAAYPLCFDTSGSERMRIDTSGNVGIGVTPGSVKLDIVGSTDVIRVASNATNATTKESKWLLRHYTNAEEDVMFAYVFSTSTSNEIYLGGGSASQNAATQISFSTAANNTTVAGTERLRITSGGNVAIGATAKLYLDGVAGTGDTYFEEVSANAPRIVAGGTESMRWTSTYVEARLNLIPSSDNTLTCGANGNRWSAVWAANGTIQTSDRTLKRDISADTLGLDFVQRLRPVSFTMNDEADGARRHGLIAQEVIDAADGQSLLGILTGEKDGEYGLNYAGFVPALIAAIQQQQTEINALKARIH